MERTNKRASWYGSYMRQFNGVERAEANGCKSDRLTNGVTDSFSADTADGRDVHVNVQSGGSSQQNGYDARLDTQHIQYTSTSVNQQQTTSSQQQDASWDTQDECVYENEPVKRSDVVREADRDIGAELPEIGMAKNLLSRFSQIGSENKNYKREVTPPKQASGKVEYSSEPSPHIQVFEGKADAGIFESQPQHNPDVVRGGETVNEPLPERGTAKNIASKFKQLESGAGTSYTHTRREITPDRAAGKVEFVSEPAAQIERYEGKADAGIFENQPQNYEGVIRSSQEMEEVLPEQGSAKSMAERFKKMEHGTSQSSARSKRELTPDRNTRGEYVSEPRAHIEIYEGKAEAGIFENKPVMASDVVRNEDTMEELLPQAGAARNMAAKFREMESNVKSPPPTPGRVKEFTPPRETGPVVVESQPQSSPGVVSGHDQVDEIVPERGTARNIVSRFRQIEQENAKVVTSHQRKKEITPPPRAETGIFENQPTEFVPDYNQKADSGISENVPEVRADVFKETDPAKYAEELPERGTAKNLVSRWKQMESQSGKRSPSSAGRNKEFTPPRNEERVRTPLSPGGHSSSVHPSDLPGQYQQSSDAPIFESDPQVRDDVFREADTDWTEGMPKENAAKKMVAKFKHIQDEAKKEPTKPISRKEDSDRTPESEITQQEATTPKKRGGFFIPTTPADKCGSCQKTVYAMEKFEMNTVVYHKNCFRCSHCKSKLTPKTFAVNNGKIYCTNHMMQLFKSKGNYDEGFGHEQHKKKWLSESDRDAEQGQS